MDTLLDRFLRYVRIDTQAVEQTTDYPSSRGQLELGRLLVAELRELGLRDAVQDEHGIVMATVPATTRRAAPAIAWLAHMDTSPETTGKNVKPQVHRNYDGRDIVLPGDPSKVLKAGENPDLAKLVGKTIITTDGIATNVSGSAGSTAYSQLLISRVSAKASTSPIAVPISATRIPSPSTMRRT